MPSSSKLAELEGQIRRGGVSIKPVRQEYSEDLPLTVGEGENETEEVFTVTTNLMRARSGMITLYNTRTGEPFERDFNYLKVELAKNHSDPEYLEWVGKPMFTLDKTAVPKMEVGTYLCPMNPKSEEWQTYKALGARSCKKHTLPNELAVQEHVRVKHPRIWSNLDRKRVRDLEAQERTWREFQMRQAGFSPSMQMIGTGVDPEKEALRRDLADLNAKFEALLAQKQETEPVPAKTTGQRTKVCDICGTSVTGNGNLGAGHAMKKHKADFHPYADQGPDTEMELPPDGE